jgi:hypothetical protein
MIHHPRNVSCLLKEKVDGTCLKYIVVAHSTLYSLPRLCQCYRTVRNKNLHSNTPDVTVTFNWEVQKALFTSIVRGPDSTVGTATGYGLDIPGIESRWGRDYPHLSRPALGPTQSPVQWVSCPSRE